MKQRSTFFVTIYLFLYFILYNLLCYGVFSFFKPGIISDFILSHSLREKKLCYEFINKENYKIRETLTVCIRIKIVLGSG